MSVGLAQIKLMLVYISKEKTIAVEYYMAISLRRIISSSFLDDLNSWENLWNDFSLLSLRLFFFLPGCLSRLACPVITDGNTFFLP